ncbi:HD family hydrolase [Nitrosopumilus sp.]|uniref:HD domain-containing protein n=1 Tax=Nitrosopumilus sp. TaxID=2024843 RepID=UPI0026163595|nr:HD domain-containing protein [Nitrosopumilus sp.]
MIDYFLNSAINLKKIPRQGWIEKLDMKNPESVADHTFMMSIMGMLISDSENYNFEKILKMILLHDLAESKIGDFTPHQISKERKLELENQAFSELLDTLPSSIKENYQRIWNEYTKCNSDESKLVHEIDKLEMAIQAKKYEQSGISKEKLRPFYDSAEQEIHHPKLKELFTKMCK